MSCLIVTALALLAGLRAQTIGTDVESYALPLYKLATMSDSFQKFYNSFWYRNWHFEQVSNFEIGYLVIVWFASRVGSFQFQLFLTSLLTVGPFYLAFVRRRTELSLPLCLAFFLFTFFNTTLNGMRQWIAVAFIFLALCGVYDISKPLRQQKKVIALLMFAVMFHTSAFMGFVILSIALFLRRGSASLRYLLITIFATFLFVFALDVVRALVSSIGLGKYLSYLGTGNISLSARGLILQLPFLLMAFFLYKQSALEFRLRSWLLTLMSLSVLFSQVSTLGLYSARIGIYFDVFEIMVLGMLYLALKNCQAAAQQHPVLATSVGAAFVGSFSILYASVYWSVFYALQNAGETIPYLPFWQ